MQKCKNAKKIKKFKNKNIYICRKCSNKNNGNRNNTEHRNNANMLNNTNIRVM